PLAVAEGQGGGGCQGHDQCVRRKIGTSPASPASYAEALRREGRRPQPGGCAGVMGCCGFASDVAKAPAVGPLRADLSLAQGSGHQAFSTNSRKALAAARGARAPFHTATTGSICRFNLNVSTRATPSFSS